MDATAAQGGKRPRRRPARAGALWLLGLPAGCLLAACVSITKPPEGYASPGDTALAEVRLRSEVCGGRFQAMLDNNDVSALFQPQPPVSTPLRATFTYLEPGPHTLTVSALTLQYWLLFPYCGPSSDTVRFSSSGPQADLWPQVQASLAAANTGQPVTFTVTVHNLGSGDAANVALLLHTPLPALYLGMQAQPGSGFSCYQPSGYAPRFGMRCEGGRVARRDTATLALTLSFSTPGNNTLALFADPDQALPESDKSNNLAHASVLAR